MKKRILIAAIALVAVFVAYEQFKGQVFTWYANNFEARATAIPAAQQPDQLCLTWSGDPRTTQAIQWRTAVSVRDGWVEFREKDSASEPMHVPAVRTVVEDPMLENDPVIHRFTVELTGLRPGAGYEYRAGSQELDAWSGWASFTTAPETPAPFTFIYMGDPQIGLDTWGALLEAAYARAPDAAFTVIAGDLVNRGNWRNEWDEFFMEGAEVLSRKPIVPVLGNHDYAKQPDPRLYTDLFALPTNGPEDFPPERAYSFSYGNAFFIVLDSNLPPADQAVWLEERLAQANATWKFALFHHPAYASAPNRDNPEVREIWGPLFEKYGVDMALQGHDHAYLRTYPMKAGRRVSTAQEGVYYAVSVSGTKYYEQEPHDYAEVEFPDVSTYQVIELTENPRQLTYRAYDQEGAVRDELLITK